MGFATIRQPVSLRRVSLLLVLGLLVGLNFTRPGAYCLSRVARALEGRAAWQLPEWARHQPRDGRERVRWTGLLWKAFHAGNLDGAAPAEGLEPPMPDRVADRLAGLDGWATAALYRHDASPNDLLEAGLADRVGCLKVMRPAGSWFRFRQPSEDLMSWWHLVLLDGQGAELGRTILSERTPGWELDRSEDGTPIDRRRAGWVDAGDAPKAAFFRRSPEGVIRGA